MQLQFCLKEILLGFWEVLCMFNLTTQSKLYPALSARNDQVKKTVVALKPILGKILLDKD